MRLTSHLLRSDVRRFLPLLAGWWLIVAAGVVLDGLRPGLAANASLREPLSMLGSLLWLANVLVGLTMVALIVQAHPVVGTDAFWMTRPIPPRTLLTSKAILLGVAMIVVPVAAEAMLMIVYRVPAPQTIGIAASSALYWTLWTIVFIAVAALTPNLPRFALSIGAAVVGMAIVAGIMLTIAVAHSANTPSSASDSGVGDPAATLIVTAVMIITAGLLLIVQYQTRSRFRAIAVGVTGVAIALVGGSIWRWPLLAARLETPGWSAQPSYLHLSIDPASVEPARDLGLAANANEDWRYLLARVRLDGIPAPWTARVGVLDSSVTTGSTRVASPYATGPTEVSIAEANDTSTQVALRRLLEVQKLSDSSSERFSATNIILFLRGTDLRRVAQAAGSDDSYQSYRGRFRVVLSRLEVDAVLPLHRGAGYRNGAYQFAIDDVMVRNDSVSILTHQSTARSMFDRRPPQRRSFYLRNPARGEAIEVFRQDLNAVPYFMRFLPFSVGVGFDMQEPEGFSARAFSLEGPSNQRPGSAQESHVDLSPSWLEQSELVIVRTTQGGSVERMVEGQLRVR